MIFLLSGAHCDEEDGEEITASQTRANHVILLEPSLDPAIQQQAVARVHRITQRREVTVHRLLVKDTVEVASLVVSCVIWQARSQPMHRKPHVPP